MNEPPPIDSADSTPPTPMPLLARMMNVFAVPGEVFENIRRSPNAPSSWVMPILIACVVSVLAALILYSQPAVVAQTRQMMNQQFEKQRVAIQKQVDDGKMEQARADEALEGMEKGFEFMTRPGSLKVLHSVGGVVVGFVRVFWWAFALWLLSLLLLRVRIPYVKALEVTGLSSLIGTLGILVTLLLQINLGRPSATPSLALGLSDFDPSNKMHMVLGALNLVQVWMILVMGLGLARLTNMPFARASLLVVAFYFLQTSALVLMGAGAAIL